VNETPESSIEAGPAGTRRAPVRSTINGLTSSTSKTRSKLTSAVTTSSLAVASAVSGA
jgi:hypothetical protein